jgi:HK97 family phage portal protein
MNIFDKILLNIGIMTRNAFKQEIKKLERWQIDTASSQQWLMPDPYIFANQADFYRLNANLGAALDLLAEDVGNATFNVKRRRGEETIDIPNHEFELLLESPNPLETGAELVAQTVRDYKLNGNAVWWLNRKSWADKPVEIFYLPFHQVQPVPDGRMYLAGYEYDPGNGQEKILLPTWQIIHFKSYNPFNRYIGLSPIESLADTLAADIGMRTTQRQTYVGNKGEPPSILSFKDYIQDDAWADIRAKIKESSEENKMMLLRGAGESVTWMSRVLSNKDMDFVAQLNQNTVDIFNRIAPGALAMLDAGANRSTADAARATYSETEWRMMQIIAKKITKEVLPVYTWGGNLIGEFDDPRFVDRQLELQEIETFSKFHTIEEVRQKWYQSDPLGDDRDDLFAVQINAQTGDGTEPPAPPPQLQPFTGQDMTENQQNETMDNPQEVDTDETTPTQKAAIEDLLKLRRMAVKGQTEKVQAFKSAYIPDKMLADIKRRAPNLTIKADIERLFDTKIATFKPQPKIDPLLLIRGFEQVLSKAEKGK